MRWRNRRRLVMLAALLAGMGGIAVARSIPFAGLAEPYRILAAIVGLIPVLVLVSTLHARFDTRAYLVVRGAAGAAGDALAVVALAAVAGTGTLLVALAVDFPFAVGAAALAGYVAAVLFFRTRNDPFYMDRDEVTEDRRLPNIDDYPEEVQEALREELRED